MNWILDWIADSMAQSISSSVGRTRPAWMDLATYLGCLLVFGFIIRLLLGPS